MNASATNHSEQIRGLKVELARVVMMLEGSQSQVARLAEENAALQARLQAEEANRIVREAHGRILRAQAPAAEFIPTSEPSTVEEALRVAIEALRIMAEELEEANEMLLRRGRVFR